MDIKQEVKELQRLKIRCAVRKLMAKHAWMYLTEARNRMHTVDSDEFYSCIEEFVSEGVYSLSHGRQGGSKLMVVEKQKPEVTNNG
jgi:hypothetical protein